jgi:hypothetical protein
MWQLAGHYLETPENTVAVIHVFLQSGRFLMTKIHDLSILHAP